MLYKNAVAFKFNHPIPHFTFTSFRFQQLRCEPSRATPKVGKRSLVMGVFGWMVRLAVKIEILFLIPTDLHRRRH